MHKQSQIFPFTNCKVTRHTEKLSFHYSILNDVMLLYELVLHSDNVNNDANNSEVFQNTSRVAVGTTDS